MTPDFAEKARGAYFFLSSFFVIAALAGAAAALVSFFIGALAAFMAGAGIGVIGPREMRQAVDAVADAMRAMDMGRDIQKRVTKLEPC